MFEQRKRLFIGGMFLFDVILFGVGVWGCILYLLPCWPMIRGSNGGCAGMMPVLASLPLVWAYVLWSLGFYDRILRCSFDGEAGDVLSLFLSTTCLWTFVCMHASREPFHCATLYLALAVWAGGVHFGFGRFLRKWFAMYLWRRDLRVRIVVAGAADDVVRAATLLERYQALLEPVGFLVREGRTEELRKVSTVAGNFPVATRPAALPGLVVKQHAETVVVVGAGGNELADAISGCIEFGVDCWQLNVDDTSAQREYIARDLGGSVHPGAALLAKEIVDVIGSGLLLVLFSPVFVAVGVLVRITSAGPVFFAQQRDGVRGRPFVVYKFRTMRADREAGQCPSPVIATPDILSKPRKDPRVTPLGYFLRRSSLDELPQLWNVLKGDMSLVGPRPLLRTETVLLPQPAAYRRLSMKPGMTGLWQVSGRSNIRSMRKRVDLDVRYVDHWSLAMDVRILLSTVPAVCTARGAQ